MARSVWLAHLERLAGPLLTLGAEQRLRRDFPLVCHPGYGAEQRPVGIHALEAVCRTLCGLAPWLALEGLTGDEARLQARLRAQATATLASITDPASPDVLFGLNDGQQLVEGALLSAGLVQAPSVLWHGLPDRARANLGTALLALRQQTPIWSNWLCFSAMVESALWRFGYQPDLLRIGVCLRQHESWYLGDGTYGDGKPFHWDYYNSFVIQPLLLAISETVHDLNGGKVLPWDHPGLPAHAEVTARARRQAAIQERLIAPDGTYPPIGRSLHYRCGAFHLLSLMARRRQLPDDLDPAQVRCALTAVLGRTLGAPGTYDGNGFLNPGLAGHQPSLLECYSSNGSAYQAATVFQVLGLSPSDPFWSNPDQPWTSVRAFRGDDIQADHAL